MSPLRISLAQINVTVGAIQANLDKIKTVVAEHQQNCDVIVFPELSLCGYPPEDLLFRESLYKQIDHAIEQLKELSDETAIIVGYPKKQADQHIENVAGVFYQGDLVVEYAKQKLPNYSVFDEKRYFTPGTSHQIVEVKGVKLGLLICEDLWCPEPIAQYQNQVDAIISLNASPFSGQKASAREAILSARSQESQLPIFYCALIGGQDELVFAGGSTWCYQGQAPQKLHHDFDERLITLSLADHQACLLSDVAIGQHQYTLFDQGDKALAEIYNALVLSVHDYVHKNGFQQVLLGLSGGIDSALTLAIAVDALGADAVKAVMMPSQYTADMSQQDAAIEAKHLQVNYSVLPIESCFNSFQQTLAEEFAGMPADLTEENLQARIRGTLLMALSNKFRALVLTTSNKSETAVGYSTLYGDMAGGFCVLKDVPKTLVYALANYRNSISPVIPERVITRAPSAELRAEQTDQDSLPDYDTLDEIIKRYVDLDQDLETIMAAGFSRKTVAKVIRLINLNEYKRRQAPPGPRITERAFGKDRRYPITNHFA